MAVFLTARRGLHTESFDQTVWFPAVHEPWEVQQAQVTGLRDQLVRAAGLPVTGPPDVPTMFSAGVHTMFGEPVPR